MHASCKVTIERVEAMTSNVTQMRAISRPDPVTRRHNKAVHARLSLHSRVVLGDGCGDRKQGKP